MLRRLLALLGLAGGVFVLAYRGRVGSGRTFVDVHYEDGSFVTFGPRSAEGQKLLRLAERAVGAVHRS
jgi:hypothetical protein